MMCLTLSHFIFPTLTTFVPKFSTKLSKYYNLKPQQQRSMSYVFSYAMMEHNLLKSLPKCFMYILNLFPM